MRINWGICALVLCAAVGCSHATQQGGSPATANKGAAQPTSRPISNADIEFMTGMIPHHAQALVMAAMAPTHGASESVKILCARIINAQKDEIRTMQNWLRDHGKPVPDSTSTKMKMTMNGMEHEMLMPGMLTDEEMAQLDRARGPEWDRAFLTFMIKHHQGAISMVETLFNSYGAAQDDFMYKIASDVYADQTTEIDRMQRMLAAMFPAGLLP